MKIKSLLIVSAFILLSFSSFSQSESKEFIKVNFTTVGVTFYGNEGFLNYKKVKGKYQIDKNCSTITFNTLKKGIFPFDLREFREKAGEQSFTIEFSIVDGVLKTKLI